MRHRRIVSHGHYGHGRYGHYGKFSIVSALIVAGLVILVNVAGLVLAALANRR